MGVSISIAVIQVALVATRFYTRHLQRLKCTWDDYLMIPALISSLGQSALYIVLLKVAGLGYHLEYVRQTPEKLVVPQERLVANQIMDIPITITPAKISILLFYLRIFGTPRFRIISYVVGSLVLATGIAFYRYVSLPHIVTDLVILITPLPFVWGLQKRLAQKLALTGVGIVTSILRMVIFFQESALADPTKGPQSNIIAPCLPPIWPLIGRIIPNKLMSKHKSSREEQDLQHADGHPRLNAGGYGFSQLEEGSRKGTKHWRLHKSSSLGNISTSGHSQTRALRNSISLRTLSDTRQSEE
ncbi:hypothetical protein BDW69DRAFT_193145 [Aspergillus filifer]